MRAEADAVAVGIGTVLADDPFLTARDVDDPAGVTQPARVVFDSQARLPLDSKLVGSVDQAPVHLLVSVDADAARVAALREAGVEVIELAGDRDQRLGSGLAALGAAGITSLLVEGGAELNGALLAAEHVDQLQLFIAPILLGSGRPLALGPTAENVSDAIRPIALEWHASGADMLASARLREW
jgi:diaminohydroxyphosphoribosylaminopyrimidine deaminase/5-amino-6-(5-phosphoribosylamino)uracil reductase